MSFKIIRLAVFAIAASFAMASAALAQSNILVVDTNKVIFESDVGKYAEAQLKSIGQTMTSELKSQMSPLKAKEDTLNTALAGKTSMAEIQQTLQARPDLQQAVKDLKVGEVKMAQEQKIKSVEMTRTQQKTYGAIAEKVQEIIDRVALQRGADIVVDINSTLYASSAVNITDTVMSQINAEMKTVSVQWERIPRQ